MLAKLVAFIKAVSRWEFIRRGGRWYDRTFGPPYLMTFPRRGGHTARLLFLLRPAVLALFTFLLVWDSPSGGPYGFGRAILVITFASFASCYCLILRRIVRRQSRRVPVWITLTQVTMDSGFAVFTYLACTQEQILPLLCLMLPILVACERFYFRFSFPVGLVLVPLPLLLPLARTGIWSGDGVTAEKHLILTFVLASAFLLAWRRRKAQENIVSLLHSMELPLAFIRRADEANGSPTVEFVNEPMVQIFPDMKGLPDYHRIHRHDSDSCPSCAAVQEGRPDQYYFRMEHRGDCRYYDIRFLPGHYQGTLGDSIDLGGVLVAHDVTDTYEVARAVGEIGAGLAIIDRDLRVRYANKALRAMFPRAKKGLEKHLPCHVTFHDQPKPCRYCALRKTLKTGRLQQDVCRNNTDGDNRIAHYLFICSPLFGPTGEVVGASELVTDATAHHELDRLRNEDPGTWPAKERAKQGAQALMIATRADYCLCVYEGDETTEVEGLSDGERVYATSKQEGRTYNLLSDAQSPDQLDLLGGTGETRDFVIYTDRERIERVARASGAPSEMIDDVQAAGVALTGDSPSGMSFAMFWEKDRSFPKKLLEDTRPVLVEMLSFWGKQLSAEAGIRRQREIADHAISLQQIQTDLALSLQGVVRIAEPAVLKLAVRRVLAAITAMDGLQWHRAILFAFDERDGTLDGLCAIGPKDLDEAAGYAARMGLRPVNFAEAMSEMDAPGFVHPDKLHRDVERTRLNVSEFGDAVARLLEWGTSSWIDLSAKAKAHAAEFVREHDLGKALLFPVMLAARPYGVLLLDHVYGDSLQEGLSRKRANGSSQLQIFAHMIGTLLARVRYTQERLERERMTLHAIGGKMSLIEAATLQLRQRYLDPQGVKAIDRIENARESVRSTLRKFRVLGDVVSPQIEIVDANEVIRETTEARLSEGNFNFELALSPDCPAVRSDPRIFRDIIEELLDNAYTWRRPGDSTVEVTIKTAAAGRADPSLVASSGRDGQYVRIVVSNNGQAIPPGASRHIFQRFYTTSPSGIGLGLSWVRSMLRAQRGDIILAESDTHHAGARFELFLPQARED